MADRIVIDIGILQGIFGDLTKLQQQIGGIAPAVAGVDRAASQAFAGVGESARGAQGAMSGLENGVDAGMRNMVADIMGPVARTQELETKLRSLGERVRTSRSVGEITKLKREIHATQRELDGVNPAAMEQKVGGAASRMRSMFGGMVAPIAGAFAVGGITAFGKGLLDAASNAQMYESSLNVILRNKGQVDSLMAQVKAFAAQTPFELTEVQEASKAFVAAGFGVDEIIPKLRTIGQTAAALGQPFNEIADFYRKVKTDGRVMGEELNQLGGRGIPIIQSLAQVMGVAEADVRKLAEQGKVGFAEMEAAFESMGGVGGRFDGIFGAAMASLTGQVSTLGDAWESFKIQLGTALAPAFTAGIGMATRALEGMQTAFAWLQNNGPLVKGVLTGVGVAVGLYTTALLINNSALIYNNTLQAIAAVRMGVLGGVMNVVSAATTIWTGVQWLLNAALTANPIGIVVMAIAALVGGIVYAWNNVDWFRGAVLGLWEVMKFAFTEIVEAARPAMEFLVNAFQLWWQAMEWSWSVLSTTLGYIGDFFTQVWDWAMSFKEEIVAVFEGLADILLAPFRTAMDVLGELPGMDKLIGKAGEVGDAVGAAFSKGQAQGFEAFRNDASSPAVATPGISAASVMPGQNLGANALLGGTPPPAANAPAKDGGVSVGGSAGSGRTITMDIKMTNTFNLPKDGNMGAREAAEEVIGMLVRKLNDAQFAMG